MTSRARNNTINGNSIKSIHEHWSMLDEKEQETSLENFIQKLKIKSQYTNNTIKSTKEEYSFLLQNKLDKHLVSLSLQLFILLSKNDHTEYLNIFLGDFVYKVKDLRKYHLSIVSETISKFFWTTFCTQETRKLFFDHIRRCCRDKQSSDLLLFLDELVLRIIKQEGLTTVCNAIGIEESVKLCGWFFDLSPDFYPWVQYEWVDKKFTFEYTGEVRKIHDEFTDRCGLKKKTFTCDHTVYAGKVSNAVISYGADYPAIEIITREPIIKAKNTRYDLCALREMHEMEFWELKRDLNYIKCSSNMDFKYNETFTTKDYEYYFFPPTQVF